MKQEDSVVALIKKQKKIEESMMKSVGALEGKVHNAAAKLLLSELRLDSTKHASICQEILKVAEKTKPEDLWKAKLASYVDMLVVKRELDRHVKQEDALLKEVEKIIGETKDEALKLLLTHIAEDERKHHKNLELIIKRSYALPP